MHQREAWSRAELILALVLTVWFGAAVLVGAQGLFAQWPPFVPPLVPPGLTVIGLAAYALSRSLREVILRLDISVLVSVGLLRIIVAYLLVPWVHRELPPNLTVPFAVSSLLIVAGTFALMLTGGRNSRSWRRWLVVWNIAGIVQLALSFGTVVFQFARDGGATIVTEFAGLPINLMPTFVTPLSLITHIVIFDYLRRTPAAPDPEP